MVTSIQCDFRFITPLNLCIFDDFFLLKNQISYLAQYISFFSRLPWNQQTLLGCIASRLYALLFGQSYVILNGVTGSYFVSIVHHHETFYKHYHALCEQINEISEMKNNGPKAQHILTKLVKFHTAAKGFGFFYYEKKKFSLTLYSKIRVEKIFQENTN